MSIVDLHYDQELESAIAQLPTMPSILDSVTHVVRSPRVCGITSDELTSVKILQLTDTAGTLIDGGSNVCVTGNLHTLLDVTDITPVSISVALDGVPSSVDDKITKRGLLPITLSDGTTYYQTCFYCANMVETIISPAAVLASSDVFYYWTQEGCKDPLVPGRLKFTSHDGLLSMHFDLHQRDGLYYCSTNVFTVDPDPVRVQCRRTLATLAHAERRTPPKFLPTSPARQIESEVWMLRFGSPGKHQLDVLPSHVIGTPPVFEYHPFRSIDFKEQAYIQKQAARRTGERLPKCGAEFFMDFVFMRSSTDDYKRPNKATETNRIVTSYDGHSSHLIVVDGASRRVWAFLTNSKEPPLDILRSFMTKFGIGNGVVRTDQGGELARSKSFRDMMLSEFSYVVEPTGADSPSQNGGAEIYNNTRWRSKFGHYSMAPASPLSSGRLPFCMPCISTIGMSTPPLTSPHTRAGTGVNRTLHTSKRLDLVSASNAQAPNGANWIAVILQESSLDTQRLIKILPTWI